MRKIYLLVLIILTAVAGCKKLEDTVEAEVPTLLNFKLNLSTGDDVKSAYITQVVDIVPVKQAGSSQAWVCNFGDGSPEIKGTTIMQVPHMYVKGGDYKVSFTTDGKTSTKNLRIHPGLRSYQIKNSTSYDFDVRAAVGSGQADLHAFGTIKKNTLSDTIFVSATNTSALPLDISGVHYYTNPKDPLNTKPYWTCTTSPQLKQYQHTVVEMNNSEKIYYYFFLYNLAQRIDSTLGELLKN
jgi:hypothetical protein